MTPRTVVLGAVLSCLGLPPALVLLDGASSYSVNRTSGTIITSGQKREYILYVPKSYVRARPAPLVISMHGAMNWPSFQMHVSRWNEAADEHGFIVVYPAGEGGGPKTWFMRGSPTPSSMPDVVFISELIDKVQASYNIDPARIYANGLSNGGGMAFALSCTLSHRIAAIGAVAAAQTLPWSWCTDSRPVPMIAFHGTADRITPYNGGKVWLAPVPFPSVPEWAANWARRNRCGPHPVESAFAPDVTRLEYTACADDAAVMLYTIKGGGHTWPGGTQLSEWLLGPTSRSIDATSAMWAFFRRHPLKSSEPAPGRGQARQIR
jgi:polyhydroxybutyrate depolymerase